MQIVVTINGVNTKISAGIWRWVHHEGQTLLDIGFLRDGTLVTNGYPEELVRAALGAAAQRVHEQRSAAAKKAALTKAERTKKRVYAAAKRCVEGYQTGPREHCYICGRGLADAESIDRGIGSECWQGVLEHIGILQAAGAARLVKGAP